MADVLEKAKARPIFRKVALGMAGTLFVVGGVFALTPGENKLFTVGTCLFVGFVMLTIARTGLWPPPRPGRPSV